MMHNLSKVLAPIKQRHNSRGHKRLLHQRSNPSKSTPIKMSSVLSCNIKNSSIIITFLVISILINIRDSCLTSTISAYSWKSIQLDVNFNDIIIDKKNECIFLVSNESISKYSLDLTPIDEFKVSNSEVMNVQLNYELDLEDPLRTSILSCWTNRTLLSPSNTLKCYLFNPMDLSTNKEIDVSWEPDIGYVRQMIDSNKRLASLFKGSHLLIAANRYEDDTQNLFPDGITHFSLDTNKNILKQDSRIVHKKQTNHANLYFNYPYAFTFGDHNYFLLNEIHKTIRDRRVETKIARICADKLEILPYTEIVLSCGNTKDIPIEKAYLSKNTNKLYVLFQDRLRQRDSRLCIYPIKVINDTFVRARKSCNDGETYQLSKISGQPDDMSELVCTKGDDTEFCSNNFNSYIDGGNEIVRAERSIELGYMGRIAFIYAEIQGEIGKEIMFVGTESGQVTKMSTQEHETKLFTMNMFEHSLTYYPLASKFKPNEGEKLRLKASTFDEKSHFIHILTTDNKLIQIDTTSCAHYASCRTCLNYRTADPLNCFWCKANGRCSIKLDCDDHSNDTCPPVIRDFTPKNGSIKGNTQLRINGENLGSKETTKVNLDDKDCKIEEIKDDHIECRTDSVNLPRNSFLNVQTNMKSTLEEIQSVGSVRSSDIFSFESPTIQKISPRFRPMSTGNLTITGKNLNLGNTRSIMLDDHPCSITKESSHEIVCSTPPIDGPRNASINFFIDERKQASEQFIYKLPTIKGIHPLNSTVSSKSILKFQGSNFDSVSKAVLKLNIDDLEVTIDCSMESSLEITCPLMPLSSRLPTSKLKRNPTIIPFHLLLDGADLMKNDASKIESILEYYHQPNSSTYATNYIPFNISGLGSISDTSKIQILLDNDKSIICNIINNIGSSVFCGLNRSYVLSSIYHTFYIYTDSVSLVTHEFQIDPDSVNQISLNGRTGQSYENVKDSAILVISICSILTLVLFVTLCKLSNNFNTSRWLKQLFSHRTNSQTHNDVGKNSNKQPERVPLPTIPPKGTIPEVVEYKPIMSELLTKCRLQLKEDKILIDSKNLTLGHSLGSGQFGCVYKGFLDDREVAVKTLNRERNSYDQPESAFLDFLQEGLMMKDFHHENVLKLIGVAFDSKGIPMVVTEFMAYGDLKTYISDENCKPTVRELIDYATQVAKGMAYLARKKFVHRDLAARNCMLNENSVVKIADFGLSRDIYETDYYESDKFKKTKLPYKWMAIESLESQIYTSKTDVWSYGILLWELMTRGVVPYPDVDNFDLICYLREGRRMRRPHFCPEILYNIMLSCWEENPKKRPTFDELVVQVSNVINKLRLSQHDQHQKVSRDILYCNFPKYSRSDLQQMI